MTARNLEVVRHKLEVLDAHCRDVGRDPATIEKPIPEGGDPINDPDGFLANMERYARMGIDLVEVIPDGPDPVAYVSRLGETVIPRLAEIG